MGHLLDEIGLYKNRRYPTESTSRYEIGGDNTELGGASTRICKIRFIFHFIFYILNKGKPVILVLYCMAKMRFSMLSISESKPMSWSVD
jgi:hypothetical protein